MSAGTPGEDGRRWVFRCPECRWEIEVTVDMDERVSDSHRLTLRCLRTTDHVGDPVVEMEVVES